MPASWITEMSCELVDVATAATLMASASLGSVCDDNGV
jgi:hypothetical protein